MTARAGGVGPVPQATNEVLKLDIHQLSDVGRVRTRNEDYADYHIPQDPLQRQQKGMLFLVADGMGGHQAGDVASRQAVQFVIGQYYGDTTHDIGTSLVRAIKAANRLIHEQAQADEGKAGMGTTLVGAVVLGQKVFVANVGDSRAYLVGQTGTAQITEDHSWVEEQVRAGLLTEEQARVHPQRNLVTRALGSKPSVEVDLFEGQINPGDSLLLCSDGLTGYVRDPEIEAIVRQNSARDASQILVDLAKERGGRDNISVMIVSAGAVPPPVPEQPAKPARAVPLLPIVGGVVLFLALVAAGVILLPGWLSRTGTESDATATAPLSVSSVPATETSPVLASVTDVPMAVASGVMESPLGTPEPPPSVAVTEQPAPATSPSDTAVATTGEPTVTLAPTETASSTPSATPTPTASSTPSPTPSPTPEPVPPVLLQPPADVELRGEVEFRWSYPGELAPDEAFQVLIWEDGAQPPYLGAAEVTRELKQKIDLDAISNTVEAGEYWWIVVVVDAETAEPKTSLELGRKFRYPGRQTANPGCAQVSRGTDWYHQDHNGVCPG